MASEKFSHVQTNMAAEQERHAVGERDIGVAKRGKEGEKGETRGDVVGRGDAARDKKRPRERGSN